MISVITPTYNTDRTVLARTWASLKSQTFKDWEWVVWDDSVTDLVWHQIYGFAADERYKIQMHKSHVHSGSIGEVKRRGFMVSNGDILVELDHDDELTSDALQLIHDEFSKDESVGFVYSDWCELLPNGQSGRYPLGWGFGYGSDYWSDEHEVWVMSSPELNTTTLKHIVSAPNHVRAWRADTYRSLNGHNKNLTVADDYELFIRTFLTTKCAHVKKMLYKQHISDHTTQRQRNALIQELVQQISLKYSDLIDKRCSNLGLK